MSEYNEFKNEFVANLYTMNIKLDLNQVNKILTSLDTTARHYDIYHKSNVCCTGQEVPPSVYEYIESKRAKGCVPATIYIYRLILEVFFHSVKKMPEYITPKDITDFLIDYQRVNPISNRTLDKYRGYICAYFSWLHDYGSISTNPARLVDTIKYEIKPRDTLTEYEAELVREACVDRRELAMVEFLLSTACRVGELVKARVQDINWNDRTIQVFGKGSKYRVVFFDARTHLALERYLQYRDGISEYLFISTRSPFSNLTVRGAEIIIDKIIDRIPLIAENKHITPHRLRSTQATRLYRKGMAISDISKILGHSRIDTTAIYLMDDLDHLKNEYNRYC